jgi:hypothetical protein
VIVIWFRSEPYSAEAERWNGEETIAPEFWISETANALWKRHMRGEIDQAGAGRLCGDSAGFDHLDGAHRT